MRLFDLDGPLFKALSLAGNLVFLNILFLIFSIPIITIGASYTALCGSVQQMLEEKEGRVVSMFWKHFKRNFLPATGIWFLLILAGGVLYYYNYVITAMSNTLGKSYRITFFVLCFVLFFGGMYLFPTQAKYHLPVVCTIRRAFMVSVMALPWTLASMIVTGLSLFVSFVMNPSIFHTVIYLWLVFVIAFLCYVNEIFYLKAFKQVFPEEKEEYND